MPLSRENKLRIWLVGLLIFGLSLYLLRSILLPFVAGMAVAYFLDPLARRMEQLGLSRSLVTIIIVFGFFLFAALAIVLLAPLVETQVIAFVRRVPGYVQQLIQRGEPLGEPPRPISRPRTSTI